MTANGLLPEVATRAGATDLFVLVPIERERLFNVDGVGRGAGWAGNVILHAAEEPVLVRALAEQVATVDSGYPSKVFGPYWARRAAAVAVDEAVIVLGGEELCLTPAVLLDAAREARERATKLVNPTKLEADQAEIEQARRAVGETSELGIEGRAAHLAATAAKALGCEYAAVYLPAQASTPFVADQGWRPAASPEEVTAALLPLWQVSRHGPVIEQDASKSPLVHRPLGWDDGVVSAAATALGSEGTAGVLVVVHTGLRPRGFTDLCARVLQTMGEAASDLLALR